MPKNASDQTWITIPAKREFADRVTRFAHEHYVSRASVVREALDVFMKSPPRKRIRRTRGSR